MKIIKEVVTTMTVNLKEPKIEGVEYDGQPYCAGSHLFKHISCKGIGCKECLLNNQNLAHFILHQYKKEDK